MPGYSEGDGCRGETAEKLGFVPWFWPICDPPSSSAVMMPLKVVQFWLAIHTLLICHKLDYCKSKKWFTFVWFVIMPYLMSSSCWSTHTEHFKWKLRIILSTLCLSACSGTILHHPLPSWELGSFHSTSILCPNGIIFLFWLDVLNISHYTVIPIHWLKAEGVEIICMKRFTHYTPRVLYQTDWCKSILKLICILIILSLYPSLFFAIKGDHGSSVLSILWILPGDKTSGFA